jgi:hypothetical protein
MATSNSDTLVNTLGAIPRLSKDGVKELLDEIMRIVLSYHPEIVLLPLPNDCSLKRSYMCSPPALFSR